MSKSNSAVENNSTMQTMSQKKLETYQLSMFPMMLQAIYNALVVIGYTRGGDLRKLDNGESLRKTMDDLHLVIESFKSVGIFRRFGKMARENGNYTLRHFRDFEKEKVLELFNPEAIERDDEMETLRENADRVQAEMCEALRKRRETIVEQNKEIVQLKHKVSKLEERIKCYQVFPKTTERLNSMLSYGMTADEMRLEIRGLLDQKYRTEML